MLRCATGDEDEALAGPGQRFSSYGVPPPRGAFGGASAAAGPSSGASAAQQQQPQRQQQQRQQRQQQQRQPPPPVAGRGRGRGQQQGKAWVLDGKVYNYRCASHLTSVHVIAVLQPGQSCQFCQTNQLRHDCLKW